MRSNKKGSRLLLGAFVAGLTVVIPPQEASATIVSYELEGNLNAEMFWYGDRFSLATWNPSAGYFKMDIDRGDLLLSYDDRDTDSVADDVVRITGTTKGCVGDAAGSNCGNGFGKRHGTWGTYQGAGDFQWDLTLTSPIDELSNGSDDFAFAGQNVGFISLLNAPANVPTDISVMIKNDKDYAFRLFPDTDGDGVFDAEGWLPMTGGVLGAAGVRGEHGINNTRLNWDLKLYAASDGTPPPPEPPTEVPEPSSLLLLSAALALHRRRAKN